jgi:hypothetical protein
MRTFAILAVIVSSFGFAPNNKKIDCSKAGEGKVEIHGVNLGLEQSEAVKDAFTCFSTSHTGIQAKIAEVQSNVLMSTGESSNICGILGPISVVETSSWNSDRPSVQGEMGGESTQLVLQPVTCDGVGTGLFKGTVENAIFSFKVEESKTGLFSKKVHQDFTITFEGLAEITAVKSK